MSEPLSIWGYYAAATSDVLFLCALVTSVLFLFFSSKTQFEKPLRERRDTALDPDGQAAVTLITHRFFSPKEICSPSKWRRGLIIYLLTIFLVFFFFTPISSGVVAAFAPEVAAPDVSPWMLPLLSAFLISGLIPAIPFVKRLEEGVRSFAHSQAGIPSDVDYLARKIRGARFPSLDEIQAAADAPTGADSFDTRLLLNANNARAARSKNARVLLTQIKHVTDLKARAQGTDVDGFFELYLMVRYTMAVLTRGNFGTPETAKSIVERHWQLTENARLRLEWIESKLMELLPEGIPDANSEVYRRLDETSRAVSYLLAVELLASSSEPTVRIEVLRNFNLVTDRQGDFPHNFANGLTFGVVAAGGVVCFVLVPFALLFTPEFSVSNDEGGAVTYSRLMLWPQGFIGCLIYAIQWAVPTALGLSVYLRARARARNKDKWFNAGRNEGDYGLKYVRTWNFVTAIVKSAVLAFLVLGFIMAVPNAAAVENRITGFVDYVQDGRFLIVLSQSVYPLIPIVAFVICVAVLAERVAGRYHNGLQPLILKREIYLSAIALGLINLFVNMALVVAQPDHFLSTIVPNTEAYIPALGESATLGVQYMGYMLPDVIFSFLFFFFLVLFSLGWIEDGEGLAVKVFRGPLDKQRDGAMIVPLQDAPRLAKGNMRSGN